MQRLSTELSSNSNSQEQRKLTAGEGGQERPTARPAVKHPMADILANIYTFILRKREERQEATQSPA